MTRIRAARSGQEAADALARIGALNGVPTSAAEVSQGLARLLRDVERTTQPPLDLEDRELDALVGGAAPDWRYALLNWLGPPQDS